MTRRWRSANDELEELERTDPAVAAAARSLDRAIDDVTSRSALHRFRPLPSDRCPGCTACLGMSPPSVEPTRPVNP